MWTGSSFSKWSHTVLVRLDCWYLVGWLVAPVHSLEANPWPGELVGHKAAKKLFESGRKIRKLPGHARDEHAKSNKVQWSDFFKSQKVRQKHAKKSGISVHFIKALGRIFLIKLREVYAHVWNCPSRRAKGSLPLGEFKFLPWFGGKVAY